MPPRAAPGAAAAARAVQPGGYLVIQGMPGAGKTTAILALVKEAASRGRSVLIAAFTNSAVDNILLKLRSDCATVPFVRLGREASVHPDILPFMPGGGGVEGMDRAARDCYRDTNTATLQSLRDQVFVYACTASSLNRACLIRGKVFDLCVVDEATQIMLPSCLGPLLRSLAFVLVGDNKQLGPLVQCDEAARRGLDRSLFELLAEAHPGRVCRLKEQYRMGEDIMALPNVLFYQGEEMLCATREVAAAMLRLDPTLLLPAPEWVESALSPRAQLVFVDTAGRAPQDPSGTSNPGEAALVLALLRAAVAAMPAADARDPRPPAERLGVISPFNAQCACVKRLCQEEQLLGAEVMTIDRCQGRDKDCIVLSLVCSHESRQPAPLLDNARRLNVALTRAKHKLIIVGDARTLRRAGLLARLCSEAYARSRRPQTHTLYLALQERDVRAARERASTPPPPA